MITGAAKVAVVRGTLLLAVRLTSRTVQIQDDLSKGLAGPQTVNPLARQIHKGIHVPRLSENLRLKVAHLAC